MATKPNIALSRWADQIGANLVAPTSGERDAGFQAGTPAASGKVNYEINQLYQWALYVNDGIWSGDVALTGSLTVGNQLVAFTDFVFTANSATNVLTATAHGLQTGDGPVRVGNSGGALPSGLLAGADYYVARIDANTFYLAPTRADALARASGSAGFEIPLNDNGTGTQTLLHQSGTTRITDTTMSRDASVGGTLQVAGEKVGGAPFSFPSTVFTASATFDTLIFDSVTIGTNHGLQTGSGPMRVSNSGGALPAPLVAGTDYWVIRSIITKIKLATSFANAMAGIAIDLTTAGTGTHSIVVGTNPTVAGNLTVHGNLTVDGRIVHETLWQHSIATALPDASATLFLGSASGSSPRLSLLTTTADNVLPLSLPIGTITKWSVTGNKSSAAGTISARLFECTSASGVGAPTQIGSTQTNAAAAPGDITLGETGLSFQMTAGRQYYIVINGGGTTGDLFSSYYAATAGI